MSKVLSMKRLATVWFVGAGVLFLLLFLQSILGRYDDRVKEAWDWFAAALLPILTLIAGAFFSTKAGGAKNAGRVDRRVYKITLGMSVLYLVVVNATVLLSPLSPIPPLQLMDQSKLWIEIFQGLVTTALGVFFVNTSTKGQEKPDQALASG